jgi:uncharacterized membrane protein
MADTSDWWLAVPRPVRTLPADLAAIVVLVVLTTLSIFIPGVKETPLRIVLGLPFVLFIPGYAFIAALFPEAGAGPTDDTDQDGDESDASATGHGRDGGIDGIERVALSFGLSIAIVPLIGLVLNFTPFGIRLVPIVVSLVGFTLVAVAFGARRRHALPVEDRFQVPYRAWYGSAREELFQPDSRGDAALNVLLVLSIVLAIGSVGYAVAVPSQGEQFTEFYVLTENESGDLVADDYPTEFTQGEARPIVVGLQNHEREDVEYSVVIELQRVEQVDNGTNVSVLEETQLERFTMQAADNETVTRNVLLQPDMVGEDIRIVFLLYKDTVPAEPTAENAYRELHLWVNVTEPSERVVQARTTR